MKSLSEKQSKQVKKFTKELNEKIHAAKTAMLDLVVIPEDKGFNVLGYFIPKKIFEDLNLTFIKLSSQNIDQIISSFAYLNTEATMKEIKHYKSRYERQGYLIHKDKIGPIEAIPGGTELVLSEVMEKAKPQLIEQFIKVLTFAPIYCSKKEKVIPFKKILDMYNNCQKKLIISGLTASGKETLANLLEKDNSKISRYEGNIRGGDLSGSICLIHARSNKQAKKYLENTDFQDDCQYINIEVKNGKRYLRFLEK